jgi:hypothetical protein
MDEIAEKAVFERTKNIEPTVDRVLLLPIVENYLFDGRRHRIALADPIVVYPGKKSLKETFSVLSENKQRVRDCIIIAHGYSPGTLQPAINYAGLYRGKEVWLVEMAKLSDEQFKAAGRGIASELNGQGLRVGGIKTFEDAVREGVLLSTSELLSPVVRWGDHRNAYVLWSMSSGTEVAICLTPEGRKTVLTELGL